MSAPTVTRPPATLVEDSNSSATKLDWARYARFFLIAAVGLGGIALAAVFYVSYTENSRTAKVRAEWDEVYKSLKDKTKTEDQIEAYEKIAESEKHKGSAVHAHALLNLAELHFKFAQNAKKLPEERAAAAERAASIYAFLAKTPPFKDNPSFGPFAVHNLAFVREQEQASDPSAKYFDLAIKELRETVYQGEGANAPAVPAMQSHYLFDRLNAQLGRLYWLRAQRKAELDKDKKNEADIKADKELAKAYIGKALLNAPSMEEQRYLNYIGRQMGVDKAAWRTEAFYIKSLLDAPGKLLPDGVAPAMREVKDEKKDDKDKKDDKEKKDAKPGTDVKPADAKPGDAKPSNTKPADSKPTDAKQPEKPTPPKDGETPAIPKTENKDAPKPAAAPAKDAPDLAGADDETPAATRHLSYSQIQKMLKEGKTALCLCPRCDTSAKSIGVKLAD